MRAVLTLRTMTLLGFFITLVTGSASLTAAFDSVDKKSINKNVDPNSPVSKCTNVHVKPNLYSHQCISYDDQATYYRLRIKFSLYLLYLSVYYIYKETSTFKTA